MLERYIVLLSAMFLVIPEASAQRKVEELHGVPRLYSVTLPPGGATFRGQKFYYTAPNQDKDQYKDPIRCRGLVRGLADGFPVYVEWHHCWHEVSGEDVEEDADLD